jgi:monovalent cation/hydrogen antiporter
MVCAIAAGWVANRVLVPYPIVMVLTGIALGFAYDWPVLNIDPTLVLAIVLPAVLYPAALDTSWREARLNIRPIVLLATGLVATTTVAVGIAFKWLVPETPWPVAFALGAIVSPPDAVAASAVIRRLRLPRWLVTVLEGESLVNDATGLVLYRFAVVAVLTGEFSAGALVGQFALIAAGGLAIGIAMGRASTYLQERLRDPLLELAMSLTTPFATYLICESIHVSGVLGIVAVGLYRARWAHGRSSAEARVNIRLMWRAIVFVVNCLVFILMGIRLPELAPTLFTQQSFSWAQLAGLTAILTAVAIATRFVWVFVATYGVRLLVPSIRQHDPASARVSTVVSWSGMRGVVSLAAALALPSTLPNGEPFPQHDLVILLAFGIVFVTLVGQGLTLPGLIRAMRIDTDESGDRETAVAREAMRRAAIGAINRLVAEHGIPAYEAVAVRRFFTSRTAQQSGALAPDAEARLWLGASAAQRDALLNLWRTGEIGEDVLVQLEREIDLAELRLSTQ